jgi:hypothetical protein
MGGARSDEAPGFDKARLLATPGVWQRPAFGNVRFVATPGSCNVRLLETFRY